MADQTNRTRTKRRVTKLKDKTHKKKRARLDTGGDSRPPASTEKGGINPQTYTIISDEFQRIALIFAETVSEETTIAQRNVMSDQLLSEPSGNSLTTRSTESLASQNILIPAPSIHRPGQDRLPPGQ